MKKPVILGVAVTNRPHIKLKDHPLQVVNKEWFELNGVNPPRKLEEDEKLIRTPFLIAGEYRHPRGDLDFNLEVFSKMLQNAKEGVGDFDEGLDTKHNPDNPNGMLGWFSEKDGGWLSIEGNVFVGYAKPTSQTALEKIENKEFKYASVEFSPNYRSNLKHRYLSTDLDSIVIEEDDMEVTLEEHEALKENFIKLEESNSDLEKLNTQLQEQIESLKEELSALAETTEETVEENEQVLALQAQVLELQKREIQRDAGLIIAEAMIPVEGRGHSQAVLDACRNFMLGEDLGDIKLEADDDVVKIGQYNRAFVKYLLKDVLPRTVKLEGDTPPADEEDKTLNLFELGTDFAKKASLWV